MSGYLIESEEMIYNILVFIKEQRLAETKDGNMNLNGKLLSEGYVVAQSVVERHTVITSCGDNKTYTLLAT